MTDTPKLTDAVEGDSCPPPCSLFRATWEERDGKMEPVNAPDLFVWACVNTKTGEVEMTEIKPYDDELSENLVEGWEWRRFRLIEANAEKSRSADTAGGEQINQTNNHES